MTRLAARNIMLRRVEGSIHDLGSWNHDNWDAAESRLRLMRRTAPARGGYDKVMALISFAPDATGTPYLYSTRIDIAHTDVTSMDDTLARHVRRDWEFRAARWTPPHLTSDQHRRFLVEMKIDHHVWAARCDTYEIPGMATLCPQCEANVRWNVASGYPHLADECRRYCLNGHQGT